MSSSTVTLDFPAIANKPTTCSFDGGAVTSDAGLVLVAQADRRLGLTEKLASEIADGRQRAKVVHSVLDMLRERVFAIALGYEDANDLDVLNSDPALLTACDKKLTGILASQPTISRLENWVDSKDLLRMAYRLAEIVIDQLPRKTKSVVIDIDATDDPCHGQQQFEFFNGYYDEHCYLPLLAHVTAEDGVQRLMAAMLRPGNAAAKLGLIDILRRAIWLLRDRFPNLHITLRADSAFCDAEVLAFLREHGIDYTLGLRSNSRLQDETAQLAAQVREQSSKSGEDVQKFMSFPYRAGSWVSKERVVAKVETVQGASNIRYVVTSMHSDEPEEVYRFYCLRGDQENRIKELKNGLSSGRTSCHRFTANQFRLLMHAAASVLISSLQERLAGTRFGSAQISTLRLRLLKIGARVKASRRRIRFHLPSSCPVQDIWKHLHASLCGT